MKTNIQCVVTIKKIIYTIIVVFFSINFYCYGKISELERRFKPETIDGILHFSIDLSGGYKIYPPHVAGSIEAKTQIDLSSSENLENYQILWPVLTGEYYTGKLSIPVKLHPNEPERTVLIKADISYLLCHDQCVPLKQLLEYEIAGHVPSPSYYELVILVIAFSIAGGFILNFMPCVLPVLSLKLLSIVKNGNHPTTSFYSTIAGIMTSFAGLGLLTIILKNSGEQFGLGTNFQQPVFIIILLITITIFLSFALGRINIILPPLVSNSLGNYKPQDIHLASFCSGVLATVLATPCTAPFLGTAMALALSGSNGLIFTMFLAMGLGFSTPYIFLVTFPALLGFLPRPGKWMMVVKNTLSLLLILTIIWLLSVLYNQIGIRPTVGLFLLLILLKYSLETTISFEKRMLILVVLIPISLYLPNFAHREDISRQEEIDSIWQKFNTERLEEFIKEGKIVVIDVTADWCVTCKYNKLMVLNQHRTLKLLKGNNIASMRADFTGQDAEIYNYLIKNNSYGIPFNIVYGPNPPYNIILPVLLSYGDLKEAIEKLRGRQ